MSGRIELVVTLMDAFAERTGLSSARSPRRYLWTDAFAVCNLLGLGRSTGEGRHLELALKLVAQVHDVLGRYRPDDTRRGWLSGLEGAEAAKHPTRAGLRIGKPLPERRPNERYDERLEWERDGQYFHYLTRWMHALDQVARATGQPQFNAWALELAETAFGAFVDPTGTRMTWKMSIDLKRPLVPSMGQHDPLDGLITSSRLLATARQLGQLPSPRAEAARAGFQRLCEGRDWTTHDPLGIGGLLADALCAEQVLPDSRLPDQLLQAAHDGLELFTATGELDAPVWQRLAFRELGLCIGLRAVPLIAKRRRSPSPLLRSLAARSALADAIEATWSVPEHRTAPSFIDHQDINEVMLATALAPEGYLL